MQYLIMQKEKEHLVKDSIVSNIKLRITSGIFIFIVFVIAITIPMIFNLLIIYVGAIMLYEWYNMIKSSESVLLYLLLGFIIVCIPIGSLIVINMHLHSSILLFIYFILIWSLDVSAMIGGKIFKGPKLTPKISPNKTWSGLVIGIFCSIIVTNSIIILLDFNKYYEINFNKIYFIIGIMIIALLGQVSDLFISCFKRKFGIKDSGSIIPGHGGMLDRFDSIILTAPVMLIIVNIVI